MARSFGGELITASNYRAFTKKERNLANKELRAYLKGHDTYISGYEKVGLTRIPIRTRVRQSN